MKTQQEKLEKRKQIFRSGLRVINRGTRYDVTGKMKQIAREIERGDHGDVRDAVLILKRTVKGGTGTHTYHFGSGTFGDVVLLLRAAESDVTG